MAKVRILKKQLKTLANELIQELEAYYKFHPKTDIKKISKIRKQIEEMSALFVKEINSIKNVSVNKEVKKKYSEIISNIRTKMVPILDQLSSE
jgi:hypothetical protein